MPKIKTLYFRNGKSQSTGAHSEIAERTSEKGHPLGYVLNKIPILGYDSTGNPKYGTKMVPIFFYPIYTIDRVVYNV